MGRLRLLPTPVQRIRSHSLSDWLKIPDNFFLGAYDAASRNTIIHPQNYSTQFDITQEFDGDGQVVKWHHYNSSVGTFYYLRSSVLGGKIVTEIHGDSNGWSLGSKSKGYVYAGGDVLAEQRVTYPYSSPVNSVVWMHVDPAGSDVSSQIGGGVSLEHEFDPMGADVGYSDPANTSPPYVPDPPVPTYTGGGNLGNPACTLDNVEYDCAALFNLLQHGSAAIAPPQTYVPVTANYSDGTSRRIGFAKWNSQNNSYEATLPYQDQDERNRYLPLYWERGGQSIPSSLGGSPGQQTQYVTVVQGEGQTGRATKQNFQRVVSLCSKGKDEGAFRARATQAGGAVFAFDTGQDIINILKEASKIGPIDVIKIHDHGGPAGLIGSSQGWIGLYISNPQAANYRRDLGEGGVRNTALTDAILSGEINLAKNAEIVLYACNGDSLASETSWLLGAGKRSDIRVTGANNSVYPKTNRTAGVDFRGYFNTYQSGIWQYGSRTRSYK